MLIFPLIYHSKLIPEYPYSELQSFFFLAWTTIQPIDLANPNLLFFCYCLRWKPQELEIVFIPRSKCVLLLGLYVIEDNRSSTLCSTKLDAYSIAVTALSPSDLITRAFSKLSTCATQDAEAVRYWIQYLWWPAEPDFRFLLN